MIYSKTILALTNGLASPDRPTDSTILRLKKAGEIYIPGDVIITSTGYTVNKKPFLDKNGYPVLEAVMAARYMVEHFSIDPNSIIAEGFSRDTIGNIFMAFQMIILPLQVQSVSIVTSAFHIQRVQSIMDILLSVFPSYRLNIDYVAADDPKFPQEVMDAMQEKELQSIQQLKKLKSRLITGQQFTKWFYDEHRAYGYQLNPEPANTLIQKAY